jgi:Ca2+-binding RTX toxin-like protein
MLTVTERHFGVNFVADYEAIGDKPWERFDEVAARQGTLHLRYPGGSAAETTLDIANPDSSVRLEPDGSIKLLTPMSDFFAACAAMGAHPTVVVPTFALASANRVDGHRTFDASQLPDLKAFLAQALVQTPPGTTLSLEIGNEYAAGLTAVEYGRIAAAVARAIKEVEAGMDQPPRTEVYVQTWGYAVGATTSMDTLVARNATVLAQFNGDLSGIDGTVDHFYTAEGRNAGTAYAQTFATIDDQIAFIGDLHAVWERAKGTEIVQRVSEWNVAFKQGTDQGMGQLAPTLEMFARFLGEGVAALDFWSAQYHPTSLANAQGGVMPAGVLMEALHQQTVGMAYQRTFHTETAAVHLFTQGGRTLAVVASLSDTRTVDLGGLQLPNGPLVDGTRLVLDPTSADGAYKGTTGYAPLDEPDVRVLTQALTQTALAQGTAGLSLGPREVVFLTFGPNGAATTAGTDGDDVFAHTPTLLALAGPGQDTLSYQRATQGASIDWAKGSPHGVFEGLEGSGWSDRLSTTHRDEIVWGGSGNDTIWGQGGNDTLDGGGWADTIHGGTGRDLLDGGTGSDKLYGGADNDTLLGGALHDSLYGGTGRDRLDGGDGHDRSWGGTEDDSLGGDAGNDRLHGEGGNDTLAGGDGNDQLFGGSGNDALVGGNGNDRLDGSQGNDTVAGGAGADLFVLRTGGGHDTVTDFVRAQGDRIVLDRALFEEGTTLEDVVADHATNGAAGSTITTQDGTVRLEGVSTITVADLAWA